MNRVTMPFEQAGSVEQEEWSSPPGYVMIAKTDRSERPWDVCGLFEDVYDASDAAGSLSGVSTVVCRLVPISCEGDGETRICHLCGESFAPTRYNQIYCNAGCRTENQSARRKPRRRKERSQRRP